MTSNSDAALRLQKVRDRIARACQIARRSPEEVKLVAISKGREPQELLALFQAGQELFGENYVQEAQKKMAALEAVKITWHFTGTLQKNKIRQVVGRFALIHTVDSQDLAHNLQKYAEKHCLNQDVLIQVNLAGEKQKGGIAPELLPELLQQLKANAENPGLSGRLFPKGLMILPPYNPDPEKTRPYMADLRLLRDRVQMETKIDLPELSMGMSTDLEVAVAEGATLVRVGTDLFS